MLAKQYSKLESMIVMLIALMLDDPLFYIYKDILFGSIKSSFSD